MGCRIEGGCGHYRSSAAGLAAVTFALALLVPTEGVGASEQGSMSTRVFMVLDNSRSMRLASRFRRGIQALERWTEAVDLSPGFAVELLVAADQVVHQGTFPLRNENDRDAMLESLRALELEQTSTTVFSKIDEELAAFVKRTARPDEQFGVVLITDGRSDIPAADLRLQELGDQLLALGGGLYAVVSGMVPGQQDLYGSKRSRVAPPRSDSRRSQSRCRRLFGPSIAVSAPAPLRTEVRARLLGGFAPVRATIQVENSGEIAREVYLQAQAPKGTAVRFVPSAVVIPANAKVETKLELNVTSPVSGSIIVSAQGPDGAVAEGALQVELTTMPWLFANWVVLSILAVAAGLLSALFLRMSRRPWFVVPIGRPDRGFEIRPGEEAPLSVADPEFPSGIRIARRRGNLWLKTSDEPFRLGGVAVQPGREVLYRLRTPIDAGPASIVLDRRSRTQARLHPVAISGPMERATASNDLL